jgi:hypothetical protein
MAAPEITRKLHIYHTLYRLNLSFTNIVAHCKHIARGRCTQGGIRNHLSGIHRLLLVKASKTRANSNVYPATMR